MTPNYVVALNVDDSPVLIDPDGRVLGGREWGAVDTLTDEVKDATEAGRLHVFPDLDAEPGQAEEAIAAVGAVRDLRARAGRFDALEDDELRERAPEIAEVEGVDRRRLLDYLARSAAPEPDPPPSRTKAARTATGDGGGDA